jgi:exoribonuclease-2
VRLGEIDEITLDVSGTVTERLDVELDESPDPLGEDDGESEMAAGPISIAVDVNEPQADAAAAAPVAG